MCIEADMGSIQFWNWNFPSIPIQELNWNCYLKKMELELINLELELELKFGTKKLNPQINLTFNFLIQKYFFHDNPTWNINYSEQVFRVPTYGKKEKQQVKINR